MWPEIKNSRNSTKTAYIFGKKLYITVVEYTCFSGYVLSEKVASVACLGNNTFDNEVSCKKG